MSSSIHIGKVSSGSFLHNDRTQKVSYLIDDSSLNECSRSSSECIQEFQSLKLQASQNYTKFTNQKMQKSTIFLKEAIINLQEHHTLKDLQPIKEKLESYGFKVLQMSIHRDEGFVNPDNQKQKNYHAHITMFNLDVESGKSVKFGKNYRTELSRLQTFTAQTLQMERGKVSVREHADELKVSVSKASKRLDTHDYKKAMKIKEEALAQKEQYNFKDYQQKITALENLTTEQKKELHSLNSAVKNDRGTIEQLNLKIQELTEQAISALERTNVLKTSNETLKERLNDLRADMSVLRAKNYEAEAINNKIKKDIKEVIPSDFEPKKSLKERFIGFIKELKETIKAQATEILSLKNQNQELKTELKEYKALVSEQVKDPLPLPDEDILETEEYKNNLENIEAYIKECEEKYCTDADRDTDLI